MKEPNKIIADTIKHELSERFTVRSPLVADNIAREIANSLSEAGFVIVPREPTEEMRADGMLESENTPTNYAPELEIRNVYVAMVSAAVRAK